MQAVILAGGKGTRLGQLALDRPKPLVEIAGKPILSHQLETLRNNGVERVLLLIGHLGEKIEAFYGDGKSLGLEISYRRESAPVGTAGALLEAAPLLEDRFLIVYGDLIFDMDMRRLEEFHIHNRAILTLAVHPNDHPYDSDLVDVDTDGFVRALYPKHETRTIPRRNLVNTGIFYATRTIVETIPGNGLKDIALDVVPTLLAQGKPVAGYRTAEFIKDVGTPDRLREVERAIIRGDVRRRNASQKRPAIFLDRDGVINRDIGENYRPGMLEILPGVATAIKDINKAGYLSIVVTNQPGIAKGFIDEKDVLLANAHIETALGREGAYLDDIYFCPHHPEKGFAGERAELKIVCSCRKPEPGLIWKAASRYSIDLGASYLIGDRMVDMLAARRAGVAGVLVAANSDAPNAPDTDMIANDLLDAVAQILNRGSDKYLNRMEHSV